MKKVTNTTHPCSEPYEMLDDRINSNELRIEKINENSEKENEKQALKSTHNQVICEICPILILAPIEVVKSHRQEKHMHKKQIFCPYCDHKVERRFDFRLISKLEILTQPFQIYRTDFIQFDLKMQ